jgi:histidyl-tRNA synthetase
VKYSAPKGTRDVLPPASDTWLRVGSTAAGLFRLYGYREIILPVMESTEVFVRGIGEGSDIVTKEMFTFEDKGGRSLTLRPEATAGVARAFVEHNLGEGGLPVKLYYQGPMFRHERPQAGRYRQFHQLGVELIGSAAALADAEVITVCRRFFERLGITDLELKLNSVGDGACRPAFVESLRAYFSDVEEELCPDCRRRLEVNPLRIFDCKAEGCRKAIFDCKAEGCRKAIAGAPRITDHLCAACRDHLEEVRGYLDAAQVAYEPDPALVRGLDYYTRTVFEFQRPGAGAQNTLAAGGRYDGLIASYGGKDTPSTGFSIGIERVVEHMGEAGEAGPREGLYIVAMPGEPRRQAFILMEEAHGRGIAAEMDSLERSVKSQMKAADRSGYRWVVVVGEDELASGLFTVRDMVGSSQEQVSRGSLWDHIM